MLRIPLPGRIWQQLLAAMVALTVAFPALAQTTGQIRFVVKDDMGLEVPNVEITLKRVWGHLNLWNKMKLASQMMMSLFFNEDIEVFVNSEKWEEVNSLTDVKSIKKTYYISENLKCSETINIYLTYDMEF